MAVTLKGQSAIYEGASTDTKPTDVDNNTIFKELDTGINYYYDGTDWNEIPKAGGGFTPTETQLTAMNSGIDSTKVAQIATNENNILSLTNNIYIRVGSGTLDTYSTLTEAIEYIKNQTYNKAVICIDEGNYDAYVESNGDNTYGYVFPDNCEVIGYGNVVISLNLPVAQSNDTGSAINHPLNNIFKNITFEAENCRYALHDDQGRTPIIGNVRVPSTTYFYGCKFIHKGGGRNTACGCGFGQNHRVVMYDCYMQAKEIAFSIHGEDSNNCEWDLYNCEMYALWEYGYYEVRIANYGTVGKSYLNLHNCKYRRLNIDFSSSYSVAGYENCILTTDTDNIEHLTVNSNCDFSTYISPAIKIFRGNYNYNTGDLVSIHGSGRNLTTYTDGLPFGVVVFNNNNECRIKMWGHIPDRFVSGLSTGFVGISNGALANVQSRGEAVGIYNGRLILFNQ
jgi:hypothetical protein